MSRLCTSSSSFRSAFLLFIQLLVVFAISSFLATLVTVRYPL